MWATVINFGFDPDPSRVRRRLDRALSPAINPLAVVDAARNVALFAGLGVVWVVTAGPAAPPVPLLIRAVPLGASLGTALEILQLFSSRRRASVIDVMSNTAGIVVGALVMLGLQRWLRLRIGRPSLLRIPLVLVAGTYGVAAFLEAAAPALRHVTLVRGGLGRRINATATLFGRDPWLAFPVAEMALFIPAGALWIAALVEKGWPVSRALVAVVGIGTGASVVAEVTHLALGIPMGIGPVISHGLAVALGGVAMVVILRRHIALVAPPRLPAALLGLYVVVLGLWSWRPYRLENPAGIRAKLGSTEWTTVFGAHYRMLDMFSVSDIVVGLVLYLPLGALLAVHPLRHHGLLAGVAPGLCLAVVTELGQLLVLGRTLDITDALVQMSGVVIGWAWLRRAMAASERPELGGV